MKIFYFLISMVLASIVTYIIATAPETTRIQRQKIERENKEWNNLQFEKPELVATNTPKGNLWRTIIKCGYQYDKVYYFDNSSNTITINHMESKSHKTIVVDN
jgi:hypothetical protein